MLRLSTTLPVITLFLSALSSCGASAIEWKSRPPLPESTAWHCLSTGPGSLCEKTFDACRTSHRIVSQRTAAVKATTDDCKPTREVWCFSYVLTPSRPPATQGFHSVREPGVDGWVYDCAAEQATCERNQERVVADRAGAGEPTADTSPCERWNIK